MQNKLSDLNNHLFAELERLGDDDLTAEQLAVEVERAKAISNISAEIISNANTAIKIVNLRNEMYGDGAPLPAMLCEGV